jgi:hypothetical protein
MTRLVGAAGFLDLFILSCRAASVLLPLATFLEGTN